MKQSPLAALAVFLLASLPAHAGAADDAVAAIGKCASLNDNTARLVCYDKIAGRSTTVEVAPQAQPQTAPPVQTAAAAQPPSKEEGRILVRHCRLVRQRQGQSVRASHAAAIRQREYSAAACRSRRAAAGRAARPHQRRRFGFRLHPLWPLRRLPRQRPDLAAARRGHRQGAFQQEHEGPSHDLTRRVRELQSGDRRSFRALQGEAHQVSYRARRPCGRGDERFGVVLFGVFKKQAELNESDTPILFLCAALEAKMGYAI